MLVWLTQVTRVDNYVVHDVSLNENCMQRILLIRLQWEKCIGNSFASSMEMRVICKVVAAELFNGHLKSKKIWRWTATKRVMQHIASITATILLQTNLSLAHHWRIPIANGRFDLTHQRHVSKERTNNACNAALFQLVTVAFPVGLSLRTVSFINYAILIVFVSFTYLDCSWAGKKIKCLHILWKFSF